MTAHVGYFLMSLFGYFAIVSVVISSKAIDFMLSIIKWTGYEPLAIFLFCVLFGIVYLVLVRYLFARTQYYIALSEVVWMHMGLTSPEQKFFQLLKKRAFRLGIMSAVTSMFEAILYVSFCMRHDKEKREDWKERFDLKEFYDSGFKIEPGYEGRKLFGVFNYTNLLWTAYQQQINNMKAVPNHKIGELYKYVDC